MAFRTLGERQTSTEAPTLVEGVPAWLRSTIVEFIFEAVFPATTTRFSTGRIRRVDRVFDPDELRRLERLAHLSSLASGPGTTYEQVVRNNLITLDEADLLRVFDEVVRTATVEVPAFNAALREAGSAYEIRRTTLDGGQVWALERRVSAGLQEAIVRVEEQSPRVGAELDKARRAIFGLGPNPTAGLQHCVKAVEIAGLPIIEPNNARGTLGTMAGALGAAPPRFTVGMRGLSVAVVESMCRALWDTERPHRHGTTEQHAPTPPSQEEAEAAFALCLILVEWFAKGVLRRL